MNDAIIAIIAVIVAVVVTVLIAVPVAGKAAVAKRCSRMLKR